MTDKKETSKVVQIADAVAQKNFKGEITKVKFNKKDLPEISYILDGEKAKGELTLTGKVQPTKEFQKSMQALCDVYCDICEITDKADDVTISVVNFKSNGVVISGQIELTENEIPVPLFLNTPFVVYENDKGGYELPKDAVKQLDELKKQAILYLQGEAALKQIGLFDDVAAANG